MSSSSSLFFLVSFLCLLVLVSSATVNLYSDTSCGTQVFSKGGIGISNQFSGCFGVNGVANNAVQSAIAACSNSAAGLATYSDGNCQTPNGGGNANYDGSCSAISGTSGIGSVKVNCNSAFSMYNISYITMILLAIIAMMFM